MVLTEGVGGRFWSLSLPPPLSGTEFPAACGEGGGRSRERAIPQPGVGILAAMGAGNFWAPSCSHSQNSKTPQGRGSEAAHGGVAQPPGMGIPQAARIPVWLPQNPFPCPKDDRGLSVSPRCPLPAPGSSQDIIIGFCRSFFCRIPREKKKKKTASPEPCGCVLLPPPPAASQKSLQPKPGSSGVCCGLGAVPSLCRELFRDLSSPRVFQQLFPHGHTNKIHQENWNFFFPSQSNFWGLFQLR